MPRTLHINDFLVLSADELDRRLCAASTACRDRLALQLARHLHGYYSLSKISCERDVARLIHAVDHCKSRFSPEQLTNIYLECTNYYIGIGDPYRAINLVDQAINAFRKETSTKIWRRIHNITAVCHFRLFNFEQACLHLNRGLNLALADQDTVGKFAILANVVALFEAMGLLADARRLSKLMIQCDDNRPLLLKVKLQNSINGAWISRRTDVTSFMEFHQYSLTALPFVEDVPDIWRALFDANHAYYLMNRRQALDAWTYIQNAIQNRIKEGLRVEPVLYCADAASALCLHDSRLVAASRCRLRELLSDERCGSTYREEVMRMLLELYSYRPAISIADEAAASELAQQLKEHCVAIKHRHFFRQIAEGCASATDSLIRVNAHYPVPATFRRVSLNGGQLTFALEATAGGTVDALVEDLISPQPNLRGSQRFRSSDYDIAENWAIAAEFSLESTGRHCYKVAMFASAIASKMGWSKDDCTILELACRLHDIGNVSVDLSVRQSVRHFLADDTRYNREHTTAGFALLSVSQDRVLAMAASVALHHHEWWNGCGQPFGLARLEIPIEARICAVADVYCTLLEPMPAPAWSRETAAQQVACMAGAQLDPSIVSPFREALAELTRYDNSIDHSSVVAMDNALLQSKHQLSDRLARVEV